MSSSDFNARLTAVAAETEALLDRLLGAEPLAGETARPARLMAAMRHAALGGGKRLRPFLAVETSALFGARREGALLAGARSNCCIAIRWCMTTCRPWTMTTCGAASRPCTRPSTRRPRSWPATRC